MPTVRISYNPDKNLIGTTREVDDAEARDLVREGRAVLVAEVDELMAMTKPELIKRAARENVSITQSATKEDIAEAIRAGQASADGTASAGGGAGAANTGGVSTTTSTTGGAAGTTSTGT
jgi:hypothetical protein